MWGHLENKGEAAVSSTLSNVSGFYLPDDRHDDVNSNIDGHLQYVQT